MSNVDLPDVGSAADEVRAVVSREAWPLVSGSMKATPAAARTATTARSTGSGMSRTVGYARIPSTDGACDGTAPGTPPFVTRMTYRSNAGADPLRTGWEGPVAFGGPNGGDGGKGGDVWLVADRNVASLLAFRDHPHRRTRVAGVLLAPVHAHVGDARGLQLRDRLRDDLAAVRDHHDPQSHRVIGRCDVREHHGLATARWRHEEHAPLACGDLLDHADDRLALVVAEVNAR